MVYTIFTLGVLLLHFQFNFAFPEIVGPDVELREKKSFASFKFRPVGKYCIASLLMKLSMQC